MIELLKERFDITRKVGQGGMATIFYAIEKSTGREYAIKILEASHSQDSTRQKRFYHEMRLLKKISSPYVVKFYDGQYEGEAPYILMEYIDGRILKDYIRNRGRLTVDEAVDFASQLALGFSEIHRQGIIHRDIKSQNIMVADNGSIKIIDFGIAVDNDSEDLTKTGMLIGSPQYVSPELINKEEPTKQSDIYALGILLYEMLAGDVPFSGNKSHEILRKHREKNVPKISQEFPNVPQSLENIILKSMAKDLRNRYKTMNEMYDDLKVCLSLERANEKPLNAEGKKQLTFVDIINSKWTFLGILIIAFLIILLVIIVMLVQR